MQQDLFGIVTVAFERSHSARRAASSPALGANTSKHRHSEHSGCSTHLSSVSRHLSHRCRKFSGSMKKLPPAVPLSISFTESHVIILEAEGPKRKIAAVSFQNNRFPNVKLEFLLLLDQKHPRPPQSEQNVQHTMEVTYCRAE